MSASGWAAQSSVADSSVVFNAQGRGAKANKDDRIDTETTAERLRTAALKPVFHGAPEMLTLRELVRSYENWAEDAMRVMLRCRRADTQYGRHRRSPQALPAPTRRFRAGALPATTGQQRTPKTGNCLSPQAIFTNLTKSN